jgi:transposase
LVAALRASGWPVYPINPMAVARYRERYSMSGKKSDHADAMVLANILRTDADRHRQLPADNDLARRIRVLARAHQDATWRRTRACNELRSVLREYYPGFLQAFAGVTTNLITREARAVLALAPTPTMAASLSKRQIAAALRRSGRQRGINALTAQIHAALQVPQLRQPAPLEDAMGMQASALLGSLDTECASTDSLGQAVITAFEQHPDHVIITSFPGLGDLTGARILGEIGDDRERFADARALKAFAGSAPVTRASGRSTTVTCRRVKNNRMSVSGLCGPLLRPAATDRPANTTWPAERAVTITPPHCATSTTACLASSTTASTPASPTTAPRHTRQILLRLLSHSRQWLLDSYQDRRSVDRVRWGVAGLGQ